MSKKKRLKKKCGSYNDDDGLFLYQRKEKWQCAQREASVTICEWELAVYFLYNIPLYSL